MFVFNGGMAEMQRDREMMRSERTENACALVVFLCELYSLYSEMKN